MAGFGTGEASRYWTKQEDGWRKAGLKSSGEEGSPCSSPPEMDMGRCLDLESDSAGRLKYGPCKKKALRDARPCGLDWRTAQARSLWLGSGRAP